MSKSSSIVNRHFQKHILAPKDGILVIVVYRSERRDLRVYTARSSPNIFLLSRVSMLILLLLAQNLIIHSEIPAQTHKSQLLPEKPFHNAPVVLLLSPQRRLAEQDAHHETDQNE
jgi:hypothetical protein